MEDIENIDKATLRIMGLVAIGAIVLAIFITYFCFFTPFGHSGFKTDAVSPPAVHVKPAHSAPAH